MKSGRSQVGRTVVPYALAASLLLPIFATLAEASELRGRVTVNGGRVLDGALVRLYEGDTRRMLLTRTDQNGQYRFLQLRQGRHVLELEVRGQIAFQGVVETGDTTTSKDIDLVARSSR